MAQGRPGFWHKTDETLRNYNNDYSGRLRDSVWVEFKTYAELKRSIKKYLMESYHTRITVFRFRRGDWGEWFEDWELNNNNKPIITKQGWQ
jgi:hypothetical protein